MTIHSPSLGIIGGGAAGYFTAIRSAELNPHLNVTILEATRRPLTKVKISGGGRCNVTHHCFEPRKLIENYPRGSKEMLGAFSRFQPKDTVAWFAKRGVELKAEVDGRMFPVTNKSQTIIDCLKEAGTAAGVEVKLGALVKSIKIDSNRFIMETNQEVMDFDSIALTTGSMPGGHRLAEKLGHTITPLAPSLFTFKVNDGDLHKLQGLSVDEAEVKVKQGKWSLSQKGPVLVTHWGLSGPAVLKLSAFGARELLASNYEAALAINWLPGRTREDFISEFHQKLETNPNKQLQNVPVGHLPKRLWAYLVGKAGCDDLTFKDLAANKKLMSRVVEGVFHCSLQVAGKGEFKEEFVTCGGVDRKEVDFRTMESKVVPNLFLAGEILDVDGITGGFNFQNAWTGGYLIGTTVGERFLSS